MVLERCKAIVPPQRHLDQIRTLLQERIVHRAFHHLVSVVDDHEAVADLLDLIEEMAGEENRQSLVAGQRADELAHAGYAMGIEAIGRFIKNQQAGGRQQRLGDPQPLLHPVRESADRHAGHITQADPLQGLLDLALADRRRERSQIAKIVKSGKALGEQGSLDHGPDRMDRRDPIKEEIMPKNADLPRLRGHQPEDAFDQCGLAGTIGAKKAKDFARSELQADIGQHSLAAIALGDALATEHRIGVGHQKTSSCPSMRSHAKAQRTRRRWAFCFGRCGLTRRRGEREKDRRMGVAGRDSLSE